ncbi:MULTISPECIES: FAD-dependent oxidoreductase [unclassified Crossiella]|uniref:FAD-dependent oxidoreductase n=1 Tax=unclassified Crossiella TaxID=2620835 RepID=UPI001FFFD775|nr:MULTISPECIES: FAD-dependent oxidoreductase [unclassified Crossiella]MCK2244443.1 FAD-dependent oxidoreductase [Crossiella sp. S99.2]MCK2257727.1 FAD-dependent oxidoreductase [Crossiella sp. S99.1]
MSHSVVVAGGGPVGLMLACELALLGVRTLVVEQRPQPREDAPGIAVNATVVELLAQRGIMDAIRSDGVELPQARFALLWLDTARMREKRVYGFVIPHAQLARRLAERAVELGVTIRHGQEVVGFNQDENGVVVDLRGEAGIESVPCRYLVGCDGARSVVRGLAGIDFPGAESPFYGLIAEVEHEPGDALTEWIGTRLAPDGILMAVPSGPGRIRVVTAEFGRATPDPVATPTFDELRATVSRLAEADWQPTGQARWLSRWENATRQAERYRAGRLFLAGDAAHVHFPLGGQALATGLEDAVNLGWKLTAEIHGWAPPGLLSTYHAERHPAGARACRTSQAQVALMHPVEQVAPVRELLTELIQFAEVNEYLIKVQGNLDVRYPITSATAGAHPLLGRRLPHVPVALSTGETDLGVLLRAGRGVVLDLSEGAVSLAGIDGWACRVDVVPAKPTAEIAAVALLLRPDGYVAWADSTGADDAGLRSALRTWFGEPAIRR